MGKGSSRERELRNDFENDGYAVMRAPSSGAGTKLELPDLLIGTPANNGYSRAYAFEAKYKSSTEKTPDSEKRRFYIEVREVDDLKTFASRFGAQPRIAVRWSTHITNVTHATWFFISPDHLTQVSEKSYRIEYEKAVENWTKYEEFISEKSG